MQFLHQERNVNLFVLDTFLDGAPTLCAEEYVYMVVLERIHLELQNFGLANYATKEKHEEVKSGYTMSPPWWLAVLGQPQFNQQPISMSP
jgi:hypothetical protein